MANSQKYLKTPKIDCPFVADRVYFFGGKREAWETGNILFWKFERYTRDANNIAWFTDAEGQLGYRVPFHRDSWHEFKEASLYELLYDSKAIHEIKT